MKMLFLMANLLKTTIVLKKSFKKRLVLSILIHQQNCLTQRLINSNH